MERKKVSFIVPSLGNMGGSVRVATQIANALADRYHVSVISCSPFSQVAFPLNESVRIFSLDIQGGRLRERVSLARKPLCDILGQEGVDVLFGIGTYETLMAIMPCRSRGVELIFCDHGALANQWNDKQMRIIRFLDALFSAKTVVLTERSLSDYRNLLHIPKRKTMRIPNWIPSCLLSNDNSYDLSSKKLLWAGRLDKEKGVDHLVDIAERVLPNHPEWVWDVYGEEVMSSGGFDVRREIELRGLGSQLRLMGKVDNLYDIYSRYAVCTLTSYREGLPLTLLEGKACKLPLISFDVTTGPADIIEDKLNGFLVKPYDCATYADRLSELMSDESLREHMSRNSVVGLEDYCEEKVLAQWEELIEEAGQSR